MSRNHVHTIDTTKALALRAGGLTWNKVGIALAVWQGRETPFTASAVSHACRRRKSSVKFCTGDHHPCREQHHGRDQRAHHDDE